jgi:hypothetical protein
MLPLAPFVFQYAPLPDRKIGRILRQWCRAPGQVVDLIDTSAPRVFRRLSATGNDSAFRRFAVRRMPIDPRGSAMLGMVFPKVHNRTATKKHPSLPGTGIFTGFRGETRVRNSFISDNGLKFLPNQALR